MTNEELMYKHRGKIRHIRECFQPLQCGHCQNFLTDPDIEEIVKYMRKRLYRISPVIEKGIKNESE